MGTSYSSTAVYTDNSHVNRVPIISPRHVPKHIPYSMTPFSKFDPAMYAEKFAYPAKEPPKYW